MARLNANLITYANNFDENGILSNVSIYLGGQDGEQQRFDCAVRINDNVDGIEYDVAVSTARKMVADALLDDRVTNVGNISFNMDSDGVVQGASGTVSGNNDKGLNITATVNLTPTNANLDVVPSELRNEFRKVAADYINPTTEEKQTESESL
jgi:hypothetical protein